MLDYSEAGKRGYLREDFRLFHLKDSLAQKLDYHYHEFDKLILVLGGRVTYVVEGVTYFLQPWDLLLIQHNLIHKPIIDPAQPYERVVVWLGKQWLGSRSDPGARLDQCFDAARERGFHLLRTEGDQRLQYMRGIRQLEEALVSKEFGAARMADTLCQQLLITVNRDVLRSSADGREEICRVDPKMEEIIRYIGGHLDHSLSVDDLAKRFFISRYYLMHRFKAVTGCTVHQYISQKRLLLAGELIRAGTPVMKAAEQAGFAEYSTFLRAFQNTFHMSPKEFRQGAPADVV
ncbi:MAG: AraC family transcriptional regulator [Oscillibacter sp.]|nr:AraC family transcriptional regulator [Oscillibacter sp.]